MEYTLTQEDIDRYGFTDATEGDKATPAELSVMGEYTAPFTPQEERAGQLSVPTPSIETQRSESVPTTDRYMSGYSALRDLGLDVGQTNEALAAMGAVDAPAAIVDQSDTSQFQPAFSQMPATATTPTAMPSADMLGLLSTPISQDPFENLSRSQRTMLGFAALKDAGMALQGKEGGAVSSLLGDFRAREDMERKRQAALAQQQMLGRVLGGAGGVDTSTPEGMDAAIATLSNIAVVNPSMASGIAVKIKNLQDAKSALMSEQASTEQGEFLFPKITDALSYINPRGLMDESGNPIINPAIATRIARGGSEWVQSQEYQEFKGNLNTIKNNYTFENMVKLKKQGVTFGALSENELRQVSELVGQLDPANPQGTFKTLNDVRGFINLDRERRGLAPLDQMTSASQPMTTDDLTPAQKKRLGY